jgi:hypothetical protein
MGGRGLDEASAEVGQQALPTYLASQPDFERRRKVNLAEDFT